MMDDLHEHLHYRLCRYLQFCQAVTEEHSDKASELRAGLLRDLTQIQVPILLWMPSYKALPRGLLYTALSALRLQQSQRQSTVPDRAESPLALQPGAVGSASSDGSNAWPEHSPAVLAH